MYNYKNNDIKVSILYNDYFSGIDPKTNERIKVNPLDLSETSYDSGIKVIEKALSDKGFIVDHFGIQADLVNLINYLKITKPDVIFNLCESFNHESINEMYVAGLFDLLKFSYTGASSFTLGLLIQKARVKEILKLNGFNTPEFVVFSNPDEVTHLRNIKYPVIVKPSREDASVGISNKSIVNDDDHLKRQVAELFEQLKQPIMVEEYIEGREFNLAVIGDENPEVLPISEIEFLDLPPDYPKIVTYNAKWVEESLEYKGTKGVCPANISQEIEKRLKDDAFSIFILTRCRDYARVDIRLNSDNIPYILEVNPNPDLSADAGFFRSVRTSGLSYEDMIEKIVHFAFKRKKNIK